MTRVRLVVLCFLLAGPAQAQLQTNRRQRFVKAMEGFSFGPRMTQYRPVDADEKMWTPGIQARLPIASETSVEASLDFLRYARQGTTVRVRNTQVTLLGYFTSDDTDRKLKPFLLLGVGWYPARPDGPYQNPHRNFGGHTGGGLEIMLSPRLSADFAYRYLWTQIFHISTPHMLFGKDFSPRGSMLTTGLNFRF
ncbi:MAG: outer membrane beta-barrel protein [Elusimicrobiota bacterium]